MKKMDNHIRNRKLFIWKARDIWFDVEEFKKSVSPAVVILHTNQKLEDKFFDIKKDGETIFIDLSGSPDEIFNKMEKTAKWSVKKSEKENIAVRKTGKQDEINEAHKFFTDFCKSKKIPAIPKGEFSLFDIFVAKDKTTGEFLGFCAFLKDPKKEFYVYKHGGVLHRGQENQAILWQAIQYAKNEGYKFFDMGGIISDPKHPSYHEGRFKFKKTFGGKIVGFYTYVRFNSKPLRILISPFKFFIKDSSDADFIKLLDKLKIRGLAAKIWNKLIT